MARDGQVVLAWQPSAGATGYEVVRGTSPTDLSTVVGTTVAPTVTDTAVQNGTVYYYAVRAVSAAGSSPDSAIVSARPRAATCATGNAIVRENCLPGTTGWKTPNAAGFDEDGRAQGYLRSTGLRPKFLEKMEHANVHVDPMLFAMDALR
jgi:hypothetical protein